jgi:hypothetical protein
MLKETHACYACVKQVPVLMGSNLDEGASFVKLSKNATADQFDACAKRGETHGGCGMRAARALAGWMDAPPRHTLMGVLAASRVYRSRPERVRGTNARVRAGACVRV